MGSFRALRWGWCQRGALLTSAALCKLVGALALLLEVTLRVARVLKTQVHLLVAGPLTDREAEVVNQAIGETLTHRKVLSTLPALRKVAVIVQVNGMPRQAAVVVKLLLAAAPAAEAVWHQLPSLAVMLMTAAIAAMMTPVGLAVSTRLVVSELRMNLMMAVQRVAGAQLLLASQLAPPSIKPGGPRRWMPRTTSSGYSNFLRPHVLARVVLKSVG